MSAIKFRCSSIGKLMTEPKLKSEVLSVGAKTYIRSLVAQEIFGVDFEVSSKQMEKGILVEPDSIALLNRVRGLSLAKNTERRENDFLTGEADLFDTGRRRGHDTKSSWSIATFPIATVDCEDKLYEYQMRGYMALWDADEWEVNYCLISTPEQLIGYEPAAMHFVDHIPEHMRLTTWTVTRDKAIEDAIYEKVKHARAYYAEVIAEFDRTHGAPQIAPPAVAADRPLYLPLAAITPATAQLAEAQTPASASSGETVGSPSDASAPIVILGDEPAADALLVDCLEFTQYAATAFSDKFPSQPKPGKDWWLGLRARIDSLQPALVAANRSEA